MTNNEATEAAAGKAGIVERLQERTTFACIQPTHLHWPDYKKGRLLLDEAATEMINLRQKVKEIGDLYVDALRQRDNARLTAATEIASLRERVEELELARDSWRQQYGHAVNKHIECCGDNARRTEAAEARAEAAERLTSLRDVLILCGELGGMRPSESEASYLRRLIDGLIDAERKLAKTRAALKALAPLSKGPVSDLVKHAKAISPSIHALAVRARAITEEK
jgi:hypothetical protein